ncbi:CBS domain-containing protein [Candidatus Bathyarchaeota archaeon]|nr:CBS domain-containing protein [Candidatus Bathyarchaeota archaeon]
MLLVKDVMVTDVVTIEPNVNVRKAVRVMNDFEIGCLIVVEAGRVVGILTERDVLKRVVDEGRKPEETRVGEVMSKPPITISPEASLETAIELMFKHKVKKLPVVEDYKLVGLITLTDLVRAQPALIQTLRRLMETYEMPKSLSKVVKYYIV